MYRIKFCKNFPQIPKYSPRTPICGRQDFFMIRKIIFYAMMAIALLAFPLASFAGPSHKSARGANASDVTVAGEATIYTTVQAFKVNSGGPNRNQVQIYFSNSGPETIDTFTMKLETHNFTFDSIETPNNGGEADADSFDPSTGIWKGSLATGQRINLTTYGTVADKPGEQYSVTATALSASFASNDISFSTNSTLTATSTNDILYPAIDVEVRSSIINPGKIVKDDEVKINVTLENLGVDSGWDTELAGFIVYVFPPTNFQYSNYSSADLTCQDEDELKDVLNDEYWEIADGRHGLLCKTTSGVSVQMPFKHGDRLTLDFTGTAISDFAEGNEFRTLMMPFRVGDPGFNVIADIFTSGGNIFDSTDNNISILKYKTPISPTTTTPTTTAPSTTSPVETTIPSSVESTTPIDINVRGVSASRLPTTGSAANSYFHTGLILLTLGASLLLGTRRRTGIFK